MRDTLTLFRRKIPANFSIDLTQEAIGLSVLGGDFYAGRAGEVDLLWSPDSSRLALAWGADAHWFDAATLDEALTLAGAYPEWDHDAIEDGDQWAREVLEAQVNCDSVRVVVSGEVITDAVKSVAQLARHAADRIEAFDDMVAGKATAADDLPTMRAGVATVPERLAHIDKLDQALKAQEALAPADRDAPLIDTAIFALGVLADLDTSYEVQLRAADVHGAHIDWTQGAK